ncbi:hypothetical protein T4B_11358 [Trichinella pseudospiralis]|uniref:Uncharacterized protein n=1 Tax=Trichinella pseudospiralis TaxID=6337 RepID=A0A0V1I0E4_TRIPS|nr:hypothetical protein T4B_11358 [Trichinella pseudospiralis]
MISFLASNLENLRTNCPPIVTITTMISGCMFLCLQFTMMLVRRFHSVDRPLYSSRSSPWELHFKVENLVM